MKLHEALSKMGRSPELVADFLRKEKVKGTRYSNNWCPVATYLNRIPLVEKEWPRVIKVSKISVYHHCGYDGGTVTLAQLPLPVRQFASHFDEGNYPELEE